MRRTTGALVAVLAIAVGIVGPSSFATRGEAAGIPIATDVDRAATTRGVSRGPIDHVVVIIEQNHTFDSYFGRYPGVDGYEGLDTWPRDDGGGRQVPPFLATPEALAQNPFPEGTEPLSNGSAAASVAFNGGRMDGFVFAQQRRGFPAELAMATNDRSTAEVTWQLADDFVLFDRYFSSSRGGSLPNQLHLFTGTDHGLTEGTKAALALLALSSPPTLFDQLGDVGVDWGFYSGQLGMLERDRVEDGTYWRDESRPTPAPLYWAPFLAMPRFWADHGDRIRDQEDFYVDTAQGTLPPVSVVLPAATDHPPDISSGQERLQSLINGIVKGPQWSSTAVFVVWDDWGGFYDHVPPPDDHHGFRVPMLLVSPWAKQGHVVSEPHDHTSVLRWILDNFDAPALPTDSRMSADFDDAFDFSAAPRPAALVADSGPLPPTPVGSEEQNRSTLDLYLVMLGLAIVVMVVAAVVDRRSRSRRRRERLEPTAP